MKTRLPILLIAFVAVASRAHAQSLNVPLTIQQTLYPGSAAGVTRTSDPVTVGIPLPDDPTTGVSDVSTLTLTGAAVGQFRVLGRWPSGRVKWVLVDTQASVSATGTNTSIALTATGSGNFGGPNLATDNGATITVATGAATFVIRKANFNGLDQVVVGGTTVIASGASQGFVVTGPVAGQTTCPCTTVYSSANDGNSTAVIEENGPAKTVIRASGSHKDASGNEYMKFTVRLYFYMGKSVVKVTSSLRNADYGSSNTFATAYKAHQGYELRLTPTLTGTPSFSIANHTASPTTGTLSGSDSVYVYQGESQLMKWQDWCGFQCVPYTTDAGYQILKNGTVLTSGTHTNYPQGWADLRDGNGAGVSIGVYQLAAYWPKSLEFNAGGSDVRIGIWPRQNSQPYYQSWPQWSSHDLYLNFHAAALASPGSEFLKFQHYLVARASVAHYNSTHVFPYPLLDPSIEDGLYTETSVTAVPALSADRICCIQDVGTANTQWPLNIYRWYAWNAGGGSNQTEFRWSSLLNFLTRGMTGRYLNAAHFYRFQTEQVFPHSDGFNWRDKTGELDGFGFPSAVSANSTLAHRDWKDQEHGHWYGMTDYYFMTGDELVKETLLDGPKDWYLNPNTYQSGQFGGLYNTRAIGVQLMGAARFSQFLSAIGDPDASTVLTNTTNTYNVQVKPDLCAGGYPVGCSIGGAADGGPFVSQGVSRTRGAPWGAAGTTGSWCGVSHAYRSPSSFQASILIQGILEFRNAKGAGWTDYLDALDVAYGIATWNLTENYVDNGTGRWDVNGFRFSIVLDAPSTCTGPGESPEPDFQANATQTTAMTFLARYLVDGTTDWATKFKINTLKDASALGVTTSDFGSYQLATIYNILRNPGGVTLNRIPVAGFSDNGGGTYTIAWTVPANTQSYRIKWGPKQIVEWIGFDPSNNVFTGNPANTTAWFAASNVPNLPAPAAAGTTQSISISTGTAGLTAANFSVKAYIAGVAPAGEPTAPPPTDPPPATAPMPPTNLHLVSSTSTSAPPTQSAPPAPPAAGVDINWTLQGTASGSPGYNGWLNLWSDPVSQQTLLYGVTAASSSIYSTDMFSYKTLTNTWTHVSGTGDVANDCSADTATQPGNRHPVWQMAVDTKRNVLWLLGGVCQGVNRQDMYYLQLNADPHQDTWHLVTPSTIPAANDSAALVYDPDDDVLFLFGSDTGSQTHDDWVYCRTLENATPGVLTAQQAAAGCATADDWTQVAVVGGVQPPGVSFPGLVYDTATKKAILFGGQTGGGVPQNQTWAYDVPSRSWTQKTLNTTAPPVYAGPNSPQPAMAYDPNTHTVLYHQTSNAGAPADWRYDPSADAWTKLVSSGRGPIVDMFVAYDSVNHMLIGFSRNSNTGAPDLWVGTMR